MEAWVENEFGSTKRWTEVDPFADMVVPDALHESLERHRANLARLVGSLHAAGVSDDQIESSVSVIIASYKEELLRAIKSMVR